MYGLIGILIGVFLNIAIKNEGLKSVLIITLLAFFVFLMAIKM
jgi:hypothetical protein